MRHVSPWLKVMLVVLAWPLVLQNWIALDASQKSWILAFLHLTMYLEIAQITSEVSLDIVQIEDKGKIVRVYKRGASFGKSQLMNWANFSKSNLNKRWIKPAENLIWRQNSNDTLSQWLKITKNVSWLIFLIFEFWRQKWPTFHLQIFWFVELIFCFDFGGISVQ